MTIYAKPKNESDNYIFAYAAVKKGTSFRDANLPVPEPSAEGYVFCEWQDSKDNWYEEEDEYEITSDMTLYPSFAKKSVVTITVSYAADILNMYAMGTFNGKYQDTVKVYDGTSLGEALAQLGLDKSDPLSKHNKLSVWRIGGNLEKTPRICCSLGVSGWKQERTKSRCHGCHWRCQS